MEEEEDCDFWSASLVEAKESDGAEGEVSRDSKVLCSVWLLPFTDCSFAYIT